MVESEIMSVLLDLLKESVGLYLATMLLSVGFNVATMLAIGYDCKAKAVKSRTTYMVLSSSRLLLQSFIFVTRASTTLPPQRWKFPTGKATQKRERPA